MKEVLLFLEHITSSVCSVLWWFLFALLQNHTKAYYFLHQTVSGTRVAFQQSLSSGLWARVKERMRTRANKKGWILICDICFSFFFFLILHRKTVTYYKSRMGIKKKKKKRYSSVVYWQIWRTTRANSESSSANMIERIPSLQAVVTEVHHHNNIQLQYKL